MARIVMKFGGTSMAGIERIRHVAGLVKREAERGNQIAVVVSAMAGETDRLVQLCREAAARIEGTTITDCGPVPLKFRKKIIKLVPLYPGAFFVSHKVLKG